MNTALPVLADSAYRDAIGWPTPATPAAPAEILDGLRALLAERRRARERRHPKVPSGG